MKKQAKLGALGSYFVSLILAAAIFPALSLLLALVISKVRDPSGAIGIAALPVLILSAISIGFLSPKISRERWVLTSPATALTVSVALLVLTVLFSDGESVGKGMLSALIYFAVFMLTALFYSRKKKRKRHR
jgi:uncharacterized membrane protein